MPPTYPVQPINGSIVSGFITPDITSDYTYPAELKKEIEENVGEYILDVKFRTEEKEELLSNIYNMTKIQFKTVKYLIKNKEWDYFHFVIIGLDRLHHAFWKYYDKFHQKYESGNKYENEMRKYYKYLDKEIGEILEILNDNTTVIIASDHGAKAMKGCLCVNMALEKLGLLKFKTNPKPGTRFENAEIDWNQTYAWGWGGYYARIFLNLEGREENGLIKQEDYEKTRDDIAKKIKSIKDDNNNPMNTIVFKPGDIFSILNGDPPDLMVYFDDLNWRSAGTVGYNNMYLTENDTGPDDAVHDYFGVLVIYDPNKKIGIDIGIKSILDIAPTALNILGIEVPNYMKGKIIKI
jgi:predicted AlkP superfamily phosphohydrolase/phosphomutase